jgi:hypothetical protein
MDRSMEVDRSINNVPFNGINSDENDNDGDGEENGNNEILLEPKIQLGRLIRQRNMPQRFLETPDTPPRIQNNRRNPRIIVDDDENELIDNFILENRNNNLFNDPQIEILRHPINMNENPMYNNVAPHPWIKKMTDCKCCMKKQNYFIIYFDYKFIFYVIYCF